VAALDLAGCCGWTPAANAPVGPDEQFTFRFLNADEVRCFAADAENYLNAALADELVQNGNGENCCFAALVERRLAAYGWYALGGRRFASLAGDVRAVVARRHAYFLNGFSPGPRFAAAGSMFALMGQDYGALADPRGAPRGGPACTGTNWAALRSCPPAPAFTDLGYFPGIGRGRYSTGISSVRPMRRGNRVSIANATGEVPSTRCFAIGKESARQPCHPSQVGGRATLSIIRSRRSAPASAFSR